MKIWFLSSAAFIFGISTLPAQEEPSLSLADINDAAAFLAGVKLPHRANHPLAATSTWKYHCEQLDREFNSHQERVLFPMTEWSNAEVAPNGNANLVRYLFSGPDILHAYHMFPRASTYVMCGLEPVGVAPDISNVTTGNASRALSEVRNALGEILNFSFFRTADMKDDLQFATFRGTTPIMSIFLFRSGQYLKSIEFLKLQSDGTLTSLGLQSSSANAVKIEFSPQRVEATKTLYYFSSDLSDGGFEKSGFNTWLSQQPQGYAYLKAASFLMHGSWFSKVRDHLLEYSDQIVQDDSGIPFRHFDPEIWQTNLYGVYTGPIDLFSQHYQSDMRAAFRNGASPLSFGTGYKWRKGESNLMRFVTHKSVENLKKTESVEEPVETVEPEEEALPTPPEPTPSSPDL